MSKSHKQLIIALAGSRTESIYQERLQAIATINKDWAWWLDERKEEYVRTHFYREDISDGAKLQVTLLRI